jgi:hypothetical protein
VVEVVQNLRQSFDSRVKKFAAAVGVTVSPATSTPQSAVAVGIGVESA